MATKIERVCIQDWEILKSVGYLNPCRKYAGPKMDDHSTVITTRCEEARDNRAKKTTTTMQARHVAF